MLAAAVGWDLSLHTHAFRGVVGWTICYTPFTSFGSIGHHLQGITQSGQEPLALENMRKPSPRRAVSPTPAVSRARKPQQWVGSGRVALRHVSPIPPLEPCMRLSPHTAHEIGACMVTAISPGFHQVHGVQLARSRGNLSRFPPLSLRAFAMHVAFPHSDSSAPSDCLEGLGAFGAGRPCLLSTLLAIPCRLSRVRHGGLNQDG